MTNGQLTGTAKLFANGIPDCRKWSWLFAPRQAVISQPMLQSPHTHLNVVVLGQEPHDWCIFEAFPIVGQGHVLLVTKWYNSKMKICQQKVNISTWHDGNDMSRQSKHDTYVEQTKGFEPNYFQVHYSKQKTWNMWIHTVHMNVLFLFRKHLAAFWYCMWEEN